MTDNLTQEQFWQVFQKLPEKTQKLILSEETAKSIFDICDENGVNVDKISEVGRYISQVLMGVLPIGEFPNTLEKEVGLKKDMAENVASEIDFRIFSNVRESLITATPKIQPGDEKISLETLTPETKEKLKRPPGKDVYREPIL